MSKRIGDIGELAFMLKATQLGFNVLSPYSAISTYDFVVDVDNKLIKVQVKNCATQESKGCYKFSVSHGRTGKLYYSAESVDIFALYCQDIDTFYYIPLSQTSSKNIRIYPNKSDHRFSKYRENIEVFKDIKTLS